MRLRLHALGLLVGLFVGLVTASSVALAANAPTTVPPTSSPAALTGNVLVSSSPAAGAQLGSPPTQLQLTFATQLAPDAAPSTGLALTCGGTPVGIGPRQVSTDRLSIVAPIIQIAPVGTCTVAWRLPDATAGAFSFDVTAAAPTTAPPPVPDGTTAPVDEDPADIREPEVPSEPTELGGPLGLARWFAYLGLAALFGSLVLIAFAWPEGVEYVLTLRFVRNAWLVALAATLLQVIVATARATGDSLGGSIIPFQWIELLGDNPGRALVLRFVLVVLCGWVAMRPERVVDIVTRRAALLLPAVALLTFGFSRSGGDLALVGHVVAATHALAMGIWFGGLALLSRVVLTGPGDEDLVLAVRGFQRIVPAALLVTVVTGAVLVYRLDAGGLFSTNHGRLVLLKTLVVGAMAYVGVLTRQVSRRLLARADRLEPRAASRLRRAVTTEMFAGVLVLGLTAWMLSSQPVKLPPPSPADAYAFDQVLVDGDFEVRLSITPGTVGANGVRVELRSPETVSGLTVRITPQESPTTPGWEIRVPLEGPGAATLARAAGLRLDAPGAWDVEITGSEPDGALPKLVTVLRVPGTPDTPATSTTVPGAAPGTAPGDGSTVPSSTTDPASLDQVSIATLAPVTAAPSGDG
jgi:copper transport protein